MGKNSIVVIKLDLGTAFWSWVISKVYFSFVHRGFGGVGGD